MIALVVVIVVVVMVLLALSQARKQPSPGRPLPPPGQAAMAPRGEAASSAPPGAAEVPAEVVAVLERAVQRGLLAPQAADDILLAERARLAVEPTAAPSKPRVPAVAEAIGYVGATLAIVGMFTVVARAWEDLATWSRLAVLGGVAGILLVAGLLLRNEDDPVVWRLRSFVLLASTGALAGFTAVLAVDALGWSGEPVAIAIGTTVAAYSAVLWQRRNRPAQQLTTLGGLLVATGGVMALVDGAAAIGAAVAVVGGVWLVLGERDLLAPREAAEVLGAAALLVGSGIITGSWPELGPVIGLTMAVVLVLAGSVTHQFLLTGSGVAGLLVFVPWTLGALFGDAVAPPVIMLVSGVLLLGVMLAILHRTRGGSGRSSPPGVHPTTPALH